MIVTGYETSSTSVVNCPLNRPDQQMVHGFERPSAPVSVAEVGPASIEVGEPFAVDLKLTWAPAVTNNSVNRVHAIVANSCAAGAGGTGKPDTQVWHLRVVRLAGRLRKLNAAGSDSRTVSCVRSSDW